MMKNYGAIFILLPMSFFLKGKSLNNSDLIVDHAFPKQVVDTLAGKKEPVFSTNAPLLIPQKNNGKFGYINHSKRFVIQPEYDIAMFFGEDCNLLGSENQKARTYGASDFATVEKNKISYRIDKSGKKVYQYNNSDLGKCTSVYKKQIYQAYKAEGKYGIVEEVKTNHQTTFTRLKMAPLYEYLFILHSEDAANPMIVAAQNNKFGVIDVNNNIIIPFIYKDIKRNYSWKLGKMFEVTKDDNNYYYIDVNNKTY